MNYHDTKASLCQRIASLFFRDTDTDSHETYIVTLVDATAAHFLRNDQTASSNSIYQVVIILVETFMGKSSLLYNLAPI